LQINPSENTIKEVCEHVSEDNNKNDPITADFKFSPVIDEEGDSEEAKDPHNEENIAKITPSKRKLQIQGKWRDVDLVVFFKDEAIIKSIKAFYGINEHFPLDGHLLTRNSDTSNVKRRIN
jgi:multisite-specific tRNA:(cytosine-C5)-methyltransferase